MLLKFKKVHPEAQLPAYQTELAAGFDFCAIESQCVWPGECRVIPTGLAVELPAGIELQVRPRSGLSLKTGIRVANSPGTIDPDYRGEIGILLHNTSETPFAIAPGDRIAQGVCCPIIHATIIEIDELTTTERGDGAYGHTGVSKTI